MVCPASPLRPRGTERGQSPTSPVPKPKNELLALNLTFRRASKIGGHVLSLRPPGPEGRNRKRGGKSSRRSVPTLPPGGSRAQGEAPNLSLFPHLLNRDRICGHLTADLRPNVS